MAIALLNVMPTFSRLHHSMAQASSPATQAVALCTVAGLKQAALPLLMHLADHAVFGDAGLPQKPIAHGDCDYCPLLTGMVALALLILGLLAPSSARASTTFSTTTCLDSPYPCGLGSRGPPRML